MSSMDRLLITAQDMTGALKHPHKDVPFSTIVYDTMTALTKSSAIFTKKLNNTPVQATTEAVYTAPKAA